MITWIARILAAWIAGVVIRLCVHFNIAVDIEQQKAMIENLVGVIIPALLTLYALLHKIINKWVNPGDSASAHLAGEEKRETAKLKALDDQQYRAH